MIKLFNTCLPAGRKQKEPQSLKEVLGILEKLAGDFKKVSQELAELKKNNKKNLQKVGVVRFNPFKEGGGDQSFSIAVLDALDNGFVITSLYSNAANRVYAKPIMNGASSYSLSQEEKEAINKAINV
ncbi:MAG: hypothetical protein UU78_C0099G0006 [Candidatus Roizmanbacteria bacterium GW2011_GWC2_41_7]|uniref:DUF4446 domain-containing protein n=1 Tax=Candidatus Roizmanbacteria bacterium GW2011_GWC2_41_7 TaxID=1618487 RepID=A0A0G0ZA33_9BACT|nr:MAG: hypothetical protein UU78_C0099G0006 [Candidatus Roizmanbacteria bacterium GW2011_GWC2_41_7]KKT17459.1 MAG: hypothetical protein UV98_C0008G0021 [Parcubacteria group bacterium GW2011_GWB1_43_6]OGZ24390.1 MAG: hypothetical protein A2922_01815 [Candidatus Nealsonbacteria bacterium RIFCSPLOWO2_01_FULL_43_36]